jgi:hypothetical protein
MEIASSVTDRESNFVTTYEAYKEGTRSEVP